MKISGFTMVRNADKYYYPIKESILSVLPIVDEFIVALGDCDNDDKTREQIESINSNKIQIIDRIWNEKDFVDGKIFANETDCALSQCSGDWCFYLQADEVIHEKDLNLIKESCEKYIDTPIVDGLLFKYYHFFGDYNHYLPFHGWYKNEIRIVRNNTGIYSYKDAQSFRKNENKKLNVVEIDAHIYHYGWVRPPEIMQSKKKEQDSMHQGKIKTNTDYQEKSYEFEFGALGLIPVFPRTHPSVMSNLISKLSWKYKLNYSKKSKLTRPLMKHEKIKYRLLSFFENNLLGGRNLGGFKNYILLKKIKAL